MNLTDFLRFLVSDSSYKNWDKTAESWFFTIIVVTVLFVIVWSIIKFIKKASSKHANESIWKRTSAWGYIFFGLLPLSLILFFFWYSNPDIFKVAYVGGLVKGIFLSWVIYLLSFLLVHVCIRKWRNEL